MISGISGVPRVIDVTSAISGVSDARETSKLQGKEWVIIRSAVRFIEC